MSRPNPMALGILQTLGFVAASREEACLRQDLVSGAECARQMGHEPFPHAGVWQDLGDEDCWTITIWPAID